MGNSGLREITTVLMSWIAPLSIRAAEQSSCVVELAFASHRRQQLMLQIMKTAIHTRNRMFYSIYLVIDSIKIGELKYALENRKLTEVKIVQRKIQYTGYIFIHLFLILISALVKTKTTNTPGATKTHNDASDAKRKWKQMVEKEKKRCKN